MKEINQKTMDLLVCIGEKHNCGLILPPFNGGNNPFYCLTNIEDDYWKFGEFLIAVKGAEVKFQLVEIDNVNYMEILP